MIELYKPAYEDLWFRQKMLADEKTMSYNRAWGGTIPFPEDEWAAWYDCWVLRCEGKRFYRYVKNETGAFVGEIAYHFDGDLGGFIADVIIFSEYRGRGCGGQALDALCSAARENGISVLYDDIAADNPAAAMFLNRGFTEAYRADGKIVLKKTL